MRRVFHPETNGVKASPHRHNWLLSRGALAAPSDPWNSHAAPVSPRQNGNFEGGVGVYSIATVVEDLIDRSRREVLYTARMSSHISAAGIGSACFIAVMGKCWMANRNKKNPGGGIVRSRGFLVQCNHDSGGSRLGAPFSQRCGNNFLQP